ncbi:MULTISPECIES: SDR family NAD(P)-dependent oxidoreductase [Sphingobium]|uniref:SDR family NAD(P)-dependent oxidoreductase n=1 Tax=Sphingobium TaxID=165695 RepID=UPI0015EBD8F0|nr:MULTISPECIES: SDR family oxidoreductase [Sphingobium]MCW2363786.1 3-oxoacyl-[acyl-carrier protein] reductase [Sphingobium sp. B10D3B]MCW2402816.1 3-oxoacyl-[acyl-carrier protein] reductase [Sphingobium sp. B10D7B]MCW2409794.1 3-oxoacyl-[acyl-carrier protein] reductase [Sphingobium xanthum]
MAGMMIIGGTRGLGGTIAGEFARAGHQVALADEGAAPEGVYPYVAIDFADPEAPAYAVAQALTHLPTLDALVIAASAMESAPIERWTAAMWDRAAAINLRLPFLAAQAALSELRQSANASITLLSSTATLRGQPFTHGYQATKAGVAGLVRSLAAELGPDGIRVNAVLPGWLDTPLTDAYWTTRENAADERAQIEARIPLRRHGSAQEAAALVCFLASPAASYLTGAILPVDGGDTAV